MGVVCRHGRVGRGGDGGMQSLVENGGSEQER